MDWSDVLLKFVMLCITVLGGIFTYYVVPILKTKRNEIENTLSESQKEDIMYWIRVFIQYAEEKYQEKNQGVTKKQFVIDKIKEIGINVFTDEELSALIDLMVKEFNSNTEDLIFCIGPSIKKCCFSSKDNEIKSK